MIFDAAEPSYFASSHDGVHNDGTRSCPVDVGPSSYCYGRGPYDYDESRYKPFRGLDQHQKKSPYGVLSFGMAYRWSIVGVMGCLLCMDDTRAFHLQHDSKMCYFDCHRWFLPEHHSYRRNKKAFTKICVVNKVAHLSLTGDQILDWVANISPVVEMPLLLPSGYVMDIKGKTKDNMNGRRDLKIICNCLKLKLDEHRPNVMSKAVLYPGEGAEEEELRMNGMKSHDCHIFMQKLIPIAFCEMLPKHLYGLENSVAIILCNLEKIFPLSFFDSIKHLIIHLPYEAHVGGLVQYRWMYQFERFLHELKKKMKNESHVEASIVEAYIVEEIGLFTSPRRNDERMSSDDEIQVSIFNYPGKASDSTN
ncbi:hypothetical protein Sango_2782700 [Sesamum angolense]|uniref:DUF4218 domain-containing protein n=1 Tax=Sesamum angolense TaxID=2727404 RepID=A0AAE1W0X0_9LAMI|nr:hypothetical protein Sango_2782700 [Sesamum angolense]